MPVIPEVWKSKPVVRVFPSILKESQTTFNMCHNCVRYLPETLNPCTGMCKECTDENQIAALEAAADAQRSRSSDGRPSWRTCRKCHRDFQRWINVGILRKVCHWCKAEDQPLKQRCGSCEMYFKDCWNNVCRRCRFRKLFCERTGWFYKDEEHHMKICWCLTTEERQGQVPAPSE